MCNKRRIIAWPHTPASFTSLTREREDMCGPRWYPGTLMQNPEHGQPLEHQEVAAMIQSPGAVWLPASHTGNHRHPSSQPIDQGRNTDCLPRDACPRSWQVVDWTKHSKQALVQEQQRAAVPVLRRSADPVLKRHRRQDAKFLHHSESARTDTAHLQPCKTALRLAATRLAD